MSYDIGIAGESFNCTWNVGKLFYDHIPAERSERGGLHELEGLTGKQAGLVLTHAFERIERTRHKDWQQDTVGDPRFCARYDAKNGWGSTVGALIFLAQLMAACFQHPRHKVWLWT